MNTISIRDHGKIQALCRSNSGERVVNVRDLNGCGVGQAVVYVIDYPKYFTPNGDGYHDYLEHPCVSNQLNAKIQIFDRYGKLLKEIRPSRDGWDGTYNGARLPSSDYWFVLTIMSPSQARRPLLNAHFTLKISNKIKKKACN